MKKLSLIVGFISLAVSIVFLIAAIAFYSCGLAKPSFICLIVSGVSFSVILTIGVIMITFSKGSTPLDFPG